MKEPASGDQIFSFEFAVIHYSTGALKRPAGRCTNIFPTAAGAIHEMASAIPLGCVRNARAAGKGGRGAGLIPGAGREGLAEPALGGAGLIPGAGREGLAEPALGGAGLIPGAGREGLAEPALGGAGLIPGEGRRVSGSGGGGGVELLHRSPLRAFREGLAEPEPGSSPERVDGSLAPGGGSNSCIGAL